MYSGIGVRDDEKRTLLHLISGCPPEEDIRDMINLLIQQLVNYCILALAKVQPRIVQTPSLGFIISSQKDLSALGVAIILCNWYNTASRT